MSGLVDSACPAFMNAGPKSTKSCVNSLALKVFLSLFSKDPSNFSHPTPSKNNPMGKRVCQSLRTRRIGFFL